MIVRSVVLLLAVASLQEMTLHGSWAQARVERAPDLAPYVPTPQEIVDQMLTMADVTSKDIVYDLGCGDGRILITAAQRYGARGVGVDTNPQRIAESTANAKAAGVDRLVSFRLQDAMTGDVSEATVVTLYLVASSNLMLRPLLTG